MFFKGAPLSFKGDNGKTETITVVNGTKEKRLSCILRTDSASYRWYKNGQIIYSNGVKYRIKKQSYLKIKNIRFSDQGDYVCVVSNAEDEVNKTIHLIVTGRSKIIVISTANFIDTLNVGEYMYTVGKTFYVSNVVFIAKKVSEVSCQL